MQKYIGKNPCNFIDVLGVKPVGHDRGGPMYSIESLIEYNLKQIEVNTFFSVKGKKMSLDIDKATELTDKATDEFSKALSRLMKVEQDFSEYAKKSSGSVRDAASKLQTGLERIEKTANFDRLERYVLLLERAAQAMTTLYELEKTGHLSKISSALK